MVRLGSVPNLKLFNLTICQLYGGVQVLYIQEKPYFKLHIFIFSLGYWYTVQFSPMTLGSGGDPSSQAATRSQWQTTDTLTAILTHTATPASTFSTGVNKLHEIFNTNKQALY